MGGICMTQDENGEGWVLVRRVQIKVGGYRTSIQITRYVGNIQRILRRVSQMSSFHQHTLLYFLYRHQYPTILSTTQADIARVYAYPYLPIYTQSTIVPSQDVLSRWWEFEGTEASKMRSFCSRYFPLRIHIQTLQSHRPDLGVLNLFDRAKVTSDHRGRTLLPQMLKRSKMN